jgi:enediyne biosynthesis protein E4
MGVGAADYDNDGYMDVFVSNDHMVNYLYHNNQGKGFEDEGTSSGVAFNQMGEATISMSVAFADYNDDGLMDLFVSDNAYCSLHENEGNGVFSEMSYKAGIAVACGQFVGWASSFQDYDNDGDLDLFKINGELKHLYGQEDQLFENTGNGKFKDVSTDRGAYFQAEHVGRGACFGDYDNDGDIDAYIVNLEEPGVLLRNNKGNQNNWIALFLVGETSNRDGVGSRITITYDGQKQYAQKQSSSGYLSTDDPRVHFGLGEHTVVDTIEVIWPSGKIQKLENIQAGQVVTLKESEAETP